MASPSVISLTAQQRDAVRHSGNLLLTACPGSGKTRTLIAKLVDEIEGVRGSPRAVCCITYTNSAVQEIEQRAKDQLQPGDEQHFTVSTIHGFCLNEIVRPYGWLRPGLSGALRVLTRDNPDFEDICAFAAARVNLLQLSQADYEAFEGLSVDPQGQIIESLAATKQFCARRNIIGIGALRSAMLISEPLSTARFVSCGIIHKLLERSALATPGSWSTNSRIRRSFRLKS